MKETHDNADDDDLVTKAQLKVRVRKLQYPAAQELVDNLGELYKQRTAAMLTEIADILTEEEVTKAIVLTTDGRLLLKAEPPKAPSTAAPKAPSTAAPTASTAQPRKPGEISMPGSRGGKWWRDDKGRVQYGERPTGRYKHPAEPEHVVDHFKKYVVSQPFLPHQYAELHEAAIESGALDGVDANFMDWFHENFDVFMDEFGYTNKDLENVDHQPEALTYKLDGHEVSYGEAVEAFFTAYAQDQFVGDEDYGEPESPEEVLDMIRETMERYDTALESPAMAKVIEELEEKRQRQFDSFYIEAGELGDTHENFGHEIAHGSDVKDASFRTSVVMKDLGLLKQAKSGDTVSRKHRGLLVVEPSLLSKDKRRAGRLWRDDNKDKLAQLNPGQLMAVYTASRLGELTDDGVFLPEKLEAHGGLDGHDKELFDKIAKDLGVDGKLKEHLFAKLENTLHQTSQDLSAFNVGDAHGAHSILHLDSKDVVGNPSALADHQKKLADHEQFIADVLEAQDNDQLDIPTTMHGGPWGAEAKGLSPEDAEPHHLIDPKDPSKGTWSPLAYQKKYVNWMMTVKRGIMAAGAGLGKTPMAITFLETLRAQGKGKRGIMFLPPSLMEQWPQEIAKFAPDMKDKILNLNGLSLEERKVALQSDMAKNAEYVLISSGTLTGGADDEDSEHDDGTGGTDDELSDILQKLDGAVFIDEAHQGGYKNRENSRYKIAKKVMEGREHAFGMTATPMPNSPMDLHTLTDLFHPGSVGNTDNWEGRLAQAGWSNEDGEYTFKNPKNVAELNKRVRPFVFHKGMGDADVVEDMGKGLPEKTGVHADKNMWPNEGDVDVSHQKSANGYSQFDYFKHGGIIDHMVAAHVEKIQEERLQQVDAGVVNDQGVELKPYTEHHLAFMAGGMRTNLHKQASISPELLDPSYKHHEKEGHGGHSPKIDAAVEDIVAHFGAKGHGGTDAKGMVIFSSYPQKAFPILQRALHARGIDPSLINTIAGNVAATKRGFMQDKLNAGHIKILLVGTESGGAGLNLQKSANATRFLDEPPSPAKKEQAQGRVLRTGQKDKVTEKTWRTRGTYDSVVEARLAGKQVSANALLGKHLATDESFMASAMNSVENLTGRTSSEGQGMSAKQIRAHLHKTNVDSYNINHQAHVDQQDLIEHAMSEQSPLKGNENIPADPEAVKRLSKEAGALTSKFDETDFKMKWEAARGKRNAKQAHGIAKLMHDIHTKGGNTDEAAVYARKLKTLTKKYPHLGSAPREKKSRRMEKEG